MLEQPTLFVLIGQPAGVRPALTSDPFVMLGLDPSIHFMSQ